MKESNTESSNILHYYQLHKESMMDFHCSMATAFEHCYIDAIESLMTLGRITTPRGMETKELISYMIGFENSRKRLIFNPERKVNLAFMLAECLWIMNGREDVEMITFYNSKLKQFSDNGIDFHGAYGPRLRRLQDANHATIDQFQLVIDKLKEDPDSRQAVCNIFYAGRDYVKTKDVPCTMTFQFFIRCNKLEMTASMRSNDVCLGLSTDGHNFSTIQELIASELGIEPGWYYHIDGSLHIYKKDYEWAQKILNNRHRKVGEILEMPPMPPNSLQYIKIIGGLEEMIRDNNDCSLIHTVPDYWQKWLLVFACYKSLKENRLDEATAHNESIGQDHPFYIFMKRSIDRKLAKQTGEYE